MNKLDVSFRRNTEQVWHLDGLENFALIGGAKKFKISKFEGKFAGYQVNVNPYAVLTVTKDERYFKCYKSHVSDDVREKETFYKYVYPLKGPSYCVLYFLGVGCFADL